MKKHYLKGGFTLVELIIVIAIIAILSVTAFLMLTKWLGKSRDSRRGMDLSIIETSLQLYSMDKNTLPKPYNSKVIYSDSGNVLRNQGEFGEETRKSLGNINNVVQDPNGGNYKYSLSLDSKTYQINAIYESIDVAYLNKVYSNDLKTKLKGNYQEYIVTNTGGSYYLRHIPSLFTSGIVLTGGIQNYINQDAKTLDNKFLVRYTDITGLYTGADTATILSGVVSVFSGEGITNNDIASMTITNAPGGANVSAVSTPPITSTSGVCGSSNGQTLTAQPTTNLCTSGTTGTVVALSTGRTWTCDTTACSAIKNDWCSYSYTAGTYNASWTTGTELGYQSSKCYVFGDEDAAATAACNQWVSDNATLGGTWAWVPARRFVTDGNGKDLKDAYYQRAVTYNSHNYICRGFAVMKYDAKFSSTSGKTIPNATRGTRAETDYATDDDLYANTVANGGIVSKAADYPVASLRQGEAISACGTAGAYHLITDNEYMAIARNIEQQGTNRTSGTVGNGGIFRGNVALTDNMSRSSYAVNSIYTAPAGNDTDARGTNAIGNRRLNLSNGSKVWDMGGNVRTHVNKSNNPSASNVRGQANGFDYGTNPTIGASATAGRTEWSSVANRLNYGPLGNYSSTNGIGQLYQYNATIFLRGGGGNDGADAGVFALTLGRGASNQYGYVGFRCVK